jgi:hypothetical protein
MVDMVLRVLKERRGEEFLWEVADVQMDMEVVNRNRTKAEYGSTHSASIKT